MDLIWVAVNVMGSILRLETEFEPIAQTNGKCVQRDEKQSGVEGRGGEDGTSCYEKLHQRRVDQLRVKYHG